MENCERYCIKIIRFFVITGLIILVIWSGTPDEQFTTIIILLVIFSLIFLPRTEYYRQDRIRDSILEQDIINISENREEILARIKEHIIPVDKKEIVCSDECTICLDDYFKKQDLLKKIDFIKIDIEGSEFRAFNGMKKILELNNNLKIFTEIAPSLLEDAGSSEKQILDFLQEHEFINFFISDNRKDTLSKITKNQLLTQLEQLHSINILCTK